MPPKKVTLPAFKQMKAKVTTLESEVSEVRTTLMEVQNTVKENHATLIALLEKCFGKSVQQDEGESGGKQKTPEGKGSPENEGSSGNSSGGSGGAVLSEFRHAVKKVELPMFNGKDPAGWISRAEIYFRIQETTPKVKIRLAQLCMEGSTIHFATLYGVKMKG